MILAGDIGGTKTVLALFDERAGQPQMLQSRRFVSGHYDCLEDVLHCFTEIRRHPVERVCLGVAGPVTHGRCVATNLPWVIDARKIAAFLGVPSVVLINDIEAIAYGAGFAGNDDFRVISRGSGGGVGSAAVIAAGTGLGEAMACWDGTRHIPAPSEGGHTDFAPRNDLEIELLRYLLGKFRRVSWERVLSGPGLYNIYRFLRDTGRGREPSWMARQLAQGDPAAAISRAALKDKAPLCTAALKLFISLYGAEAGNLALQIRATGGVYIGGGIAPRIVDSLCDGTFMENFRDKGRMRPLMERIPVSVILNRDCALLGAAHCAWLKETGGCLVLTGAAP
jgi:glucokinase